MTCSLEGSGWGGVNIFNINTQIYFSITTSVVVSSVENLPCTAKVTCPIKINGEIILGGVCFNLPASRVALSCLSSWVCHDVSLCVIHAAAEDLPVFLLSRFQKKSNKSIPILVIWKIFKVSVSLVFPSGYLYVCVCEREKRDESERRRTEGVREWRGALIIVKEGRDRWLH